MSVAPTEDRVPSASRVALAYATVCLVWGSTYLAIRFAVETLPPLLMASTRYLVAGAILFPLARRAAPGPLTKRQWIGAAIVGTLMLLGGNGLVCWSEQHVVSSLAALLIATIPLWMILFDWLFYRGARPTRVAIIGLALGLTGVYFLVDPAGLAGERVYLPGAVALLAACVFWALGSLYSRRCQQPASTPLATAMQMLTGGSALGIVGLLAGEAERVNFAAISFRSVAALAYLVIFGSLLAMSAYVWLLQHRPAAQVSTYAFVNPVVAVFLGVAVAGEPFTPRTALGGALILAAVGMITLSSRIAGRSARRAVQPVKQTDRDMVVSATVTFDGDT